MSRPISVAGKPSMSVPAANWLRCFTTAPARTMHPTPTTLWSQTMAPTTFAGGHPDSDETKRALRHTSRVKTAGIMGGAMQRE
ncbi:MAG TPA: hypothetical protein VKD67_07345, partial [Acidimicrobiales bacterium]|nr:hypothetical protein [Acidimicrobiales bacterium]